MIILRYGGFTLLLGAILLIGGEGLRYLESGQVDFFTLDQLWRWLDPKGLANFSSVVRDGPFPLLWPDVIEPLLATPLVVIWGVLGGILIFLGRKRAHEA